MGSEPRDGALRGWQLRIARGRLVRGGRLLLLVLTVAVLASTAVTSVGLLVGVTEQSAVLTSLNAISGEEARMSVDIEQPSKPVASNERSVDLAIKAVLGRAGTATRTLRAFAQPTDQTIDGHSVAPYFAELEGVAGHVKLVHGSIPRTTPAGGAGNATAVSVAIPQVAASRLHLGVGSTFVYKSTRQITVTVVGTYTIVGPDTPYWSQDELQAAGFQQNFGISTNNSFTVATAFGPLLAPPGSLDAINVLADRIELDYTPKFTTTDAAQLAPLINRLQAASSSVPVAISGGAQQVTFSGNATIPLQQIIAAVAVTRSSVVVITLLLLVLSIAALGQAARLFNDARAGDRELMRARGSSRGQILAVAVLEASVVGVLTALVSAPLARLVYFAVAAQPAMRAAGVPRDSGLPLSAWLTSVGLGVVFIVVLLLSLLGRTASFVAAEQARSRQRRVTGLLRSGLDLGVVVLAVLAFWQLSIYKTPVGSTTNLTVDPVLVSAPALVLLAGALLAARLFPLLARLIDGAGSRSSGVLFRLASWEVGRRSQRATAVVLLLTLALAVATFSQTFLATWTQSQIDRADYAVGPAVRVGATPGEGGAERAHLTKDAIGQPQPVTRRVADTAAVNGGGVDTPAVVLGLTPGARAMLDKGRLAAEGGSAIVAGLRGSSSPAAGIVLPGNPQGISAQFQVGDSHVRMPGVAAEVQLVVQDAAGQLSTLSLGTVPVDGKPHTVVGKLPALPAGVTRALPLSVVGVEGGVFPTGSASYVPNEPLATKVLLGKLGSATFAADDSFTSKPATDGSAAQWSVGTDESGSTAPQRTTEPGWQIALAMTIPGNVEQNASQFVETAWPTQDRIPVVVSSSLASLLDLKVGTSLSLNFPFASANVQVAAIARLIPGTVDSSLLTPSTAAGAASAGSYAVVVDQTALERALVSSGSSGSYLDEWWVDVAPQHAAAYLAAHPGPAGSEPSRSSALLALEMQQSPLRVATQASLWLAIVAAALLAAIGFAVHSASTLTARRIELAQLRAIGLSRRRLVQLIGVESAVQAALGALFGIVVGVVLGLLAAPLIALSPNGTPAVPDVRVLVPWLQVVLLIAALALVLLAVVGAVARGQRSANPATILREADNG